LIEKARRCGSATLFIRHSHHCAALWPDLEPFTEAGFVALTTINTRNRMTAWEGPRPALGTNPMAFGCPRGNGLPPVIWDQAASVMSHGDLTLARRAGREVEPRAGLNAQGQATTSPSEILDGGVLLPFGGPKGASIAFMAEILAAACSGSEFGFEDAAASVPGATTSLGSQFVMVIDVGVAARPFAERVEQLLAAIQAAGSQRLPGTRRYAHRAKALQHGVDISEEDFELLGIDR
jgi:delta1-piperideine-2-carboxylate reductase